MRLDWIQTILPFTLAVICFKPGYAQYWQQRADVNMVIDFNAENHQFSGEQTLTYKNNSPDTLRQVFYHLYFNAFQPNTMMDVRSRTLPDPDPRIGSRLSRLSADEIGYHKIRSLTQDGRKVDFKVEETILQAMLPQPIMPGQTSTFQMEFDSQVPIQIRRSGRTNAEGIDYSMAQWYPKISAYDQDGWHPNPYIQREFYGEFGDFDVTIKIDPEFIVAATGVPQETQAEVAPQSSGSGSPGSYSGNRPWELAGAKEDEEPSANPVSLSGKKTWRFTASNVPDFVWAADKEYKHTKRIAADGTELHFYFVETSENENAWRQLPPIMDRALQLANQHFGKYPYPRYSFIQGGDGGMEYPMATLITGNRPITSLAGVSVHEILHSWYQCVLGTDEAQYAWMDEGFATYAENFINNELAKEGLLPGREPVDHIMLGDYQRYAQFALSGVEEPMTTHSDHYRTNTGYGVGSYTKGGIFLYQLEYIMGKDDFAKGMLRYYNNWKFKHPTPRIFLREMEKASGLVLDWYLEYFLGTTKYIDYSFGEVVPTGTGETRVLLRREGDMPMPIDLVVRKTDGSTIGYYIPLGLMRGEKKPDFPADEWFVFDDWAWTHPAFSIRLPYDINEIESIEIDPSGRMADVRPDNNIFRNTGGN